METQENTNQNKKILAGPLSLRAFLTPRDAENLVEDNGSDGVDNNVNPQETKISPSVAELDAETFQILCGVPHGAEIAIALSTGVQQIS